MTRGETIIMCQDCGIRPIKHVGCGQCGECYTAMLAGMQAREDAGDCYWCGLKGGADFCESCASASPDCSSCRQPMTGASWGSRGQCLSCYGRLTLVYVDAPLAAREELYGVEA